MRTIGAIAGATAMSLLVSGVSAFLAAPVPAVAAQVHDVELVDDTGSHIVVLDDGVRASSVIDGEDIVENLAETDTVVADLTSAQAQTLANDPRVTSVEKNQVISLSRTPVQAATASWGLDRLDDRRLPLNGRYSPPNHGARTHIYVVDSGVNRRHPEFAGRIGASAYLGSVGSSAGDCFGHGTHVAGIAGSNRYGVARQTVIHSMRILDCSGQGTSGGTVVMLNWIAGNAEPRSIVNLSVGATPSAAISSAVNTLVSRGIVVVAAAGNEGVDACTRSPAQIPAAITVAATTSNDQQASFSNYGRCVDLYAPGVQITSTSHRSDSLGAVKSGTSMAAPHVSGAVAIYWALHPRKSGAAVTAGVLRNASRNILRGLSPETKNRNLSVRFPTRPSRVRNIRVRIKKRRTLVTWRIPSRSGNARRTYQWRYKVRGKKLRRWHSTTKRRAVLPRARGHRVHVVQIRSRNVDFVGPVRNRKYRR